MWKKVIIISSLVFISGCKTISVQHQKQQLAVSVPELGSVGMEEGNLLHNNFQQVGMPELSQKIRIQAKRIPFDKNSYKAYAKYLEEAGQESPLQFSDSLPQKPIYLHLSVMDRIGIKEALNQPKNKALLSYLENDKAYKIVSEITTVVKPELLQSFSEAEEVYLVQKGISKLGLELIKDGKVFREVNFSALSPFAYQLSSFCWGENYKHQTVIEAIVDGNPCPKNTYKKAHKIEKKKDVFRFR